jgi:ATP-binding cassette subfamily F protein 3
MAFIQLKSLRLSYGERVLFEDLSATLDSTSRVALVGVNGAGKSTLIKLLTQSLQPDSGEIVCSKECRLGYMAQSAQVELTRPLFSEVEQAFAYLFALDHQATELAHNHDEESLQKMADLHDQLAHSRFYEREGLIDATLRGLGFKVSDFTRPMGDFSSGWRMRAALARVLLALPDVLLLDEPSNYLDLETTQWLIDWLKRFNGGLMVVSHDRYFLDQVTRETWELFDKQLKRYAFPYSVYEVRRREEIAALVKQREQQESRLEQIEDFARRFGSSATKATLVQSRLKEAEKLRAALVSLPEANKALSIRFPSPVPCGERVLYVEDLVKNYDDQQVFSNLTLLVNKGEKIAITGPNGAGKSTFLRIVAGIMKSTSGFLKLGSGVQVGYFSEETHEPFVAETVLGELEAIAPVAMQPQLRHLLGAFLFQNDDVFKPIMALSGGERARLLLLRLFLKPFNLLILDEPTNHLDLQAKEMLLEAIKSYAGTVLFVSHDRYFSQQLAQAVLYVQATPRYFPGDYAYYLSQVEKGALLTDVPLSTPKKPKAEPASATQQQRSEQKASQTQERRRLRQEEQVLIQIEQVEAHLAMLEPQLGDEVIYRDVERMKVLKHQIALAHEELAQLYEQWEQLSN